MPKPTLSICIPTYNREKFLKECLESIEIQNTSKIEIVISDNGSSDNTLSVVEMYKNKLPILFHRFESNQGFDINCAKTVELATGTYCMLLGSDDAILPGAIENILNEIEHSSFDILHSGYRQCELDIKIKRNDVILNKSAQKNINISNADKYFQQLPNLSTAFAFISTFVFKRDTWPSPEIYQKWIGSNYIHLFCMHHLLVEGCIIKSTGDLYISARGNNINEWSSEPGKHLALDARTFSKVISELYLNNKKIQKSISEVFKKSYPQRSLLRILADGGGKYIAQSSHELMHLGYGKLFILSLITVHIMGLKSTLSIMLGIRKKLKSI